MQHAFNTPFESNLFQFASQKLGFTPSPLNMLQVDRIQKCLSRYMNPAVDILLHFPFLPTEPITFTAPGFFFSVIGGAGWVERGRFPPLFIPNTTIHLLLCVCKYMYVFLPSGHSIFLLVLSTVINTCVPLASRQPKPSPKCGGVPVADGLAWWWVKNLY